MPDQTRTPLRRDAVDNRERLLQAARRLFAEVGHDVPLEDVARAAGVSRTTLYRNFVTRQELAAVVYAANVDRIERRAVELADLDDGVVLLLDDVFEEQANDRSLARMLSADEIELFTVLSARTEEAFRPLVERGRRAGIVHAAVDVADVMVALAMSSGALADIGQSSRENLVARVRGLLHRALFAHSDLH